MNFHTHLCDSHVDVLVAEDLIVQLPNVSRSDAGWSMIHQRTATLQRFCLFKTSLAGLQLLIVTLSYSPTIQISLMPWNQESILWTKRCISPICFNVSGSFSYAHDASANLCFCQCFITSFWVPQICSNVLGYRSIAKRLRG